jgi:hypothetical protein
MIVTLLERKDKERKEKKKRKKKKMKKKKEEKKKFYAHNIVNKKERDRG